MGAGAMGTSPQLEVRSPAISTPVGVTAHYRFNEGELGACCLEMAVSSALRRSATEPHWTNQGGLTEAYSDTSKPA